MNGEVLSSVSLMSKFSLIFFCFIIFMYRTYSRLVNICMFKLFCNVYISRLYLIWRSRGGGDWATGTSGPREGWRFQPIRLYHLKRNVTWLDKMWSQRAAWLLARKQEMLEEMNPWKMTEYYLEWMKEEKSLSQTFPHFWRDGCGSWLINVCRVKHVIKNC